MAPSCKHVREVPQDGVVKSLDVRPVMKVTAVLPLDIVSKSDHGSTVNSHIIQAARAKIIVRHRIVNSTTGQVQTQTRYHPKEPQRELLALSSEACFTVERAFMPARSQDKSQLHMMTDLISTRTISLICSNHTTSKQLSVSSNFKT